jgi:hypothetical protein
VRCTPLQNQAGGSFSGYQQFGGAATDAPQQALRGPPPPDRPHDNGWVGSGGAAQQHPAAQQQRAAIGTGLVRDPKQTILYILKVQPEH